MHKATMLLLIVIMSFYPLFTRATSKEITEEKVCIEGGKVCGVWYSFHSGAAPFPHPTSDKGMCVTTPASKKDPEMSQGKCSRGKEFIPASAFQDDRVSLFVPNVVQKLTAGVDALVYFHGVNNELANLRENPKYRFAEKILALHTPLVLIIPQGPLNVWSYFWGNLEETGGLKKLLDEVRKSLASDFDTNLSSFDHLIVSGQSGGFEGVGMTVKKGSTKIDAVFIFDALYGLSNNIQDWLVKNHGTVLYGAHTDHLARAYEELQKGALAKGVDPTRIQFVEADVVHSHVSGRYIEEFLRKELIRWQKK